jgi:hypothetical protein
VLQLRDHDTAPVVVFLCCHSIIDSLRFFVGWSATLEKDFILVSGSTDHTLPRQVDARFAAFGPTERQLVSHISDHPHLVHWFVANLDEIGHPKISPLPLGMVFKTGAPPEGSVVPKVRQLADRPLRVFCAHRHREGPQWELRRRVTALASGPWRNFCTVPAAELPEPDFMAEVERHSFVICAEGGGLDPSPKAWSALLHGAIPIIRATALAPAYAHLPVVMVNDWSEDALTEERLAAWRDKLRPWFDVPEKRQEIVRRLSIDYWWKIIEAGRPVESALRLSVG